MVLTRGHTLASARPARCRQCNGWIAPSEPWLVDEDAPWLAIHVDCLQELAPERVVQLYDDIESCSEDDYRARAELRRRLDALREELDRLQDWLDGQTRYIPEFFRPGIRRVPIKRDPRRC